jgi:hypothetical protein
MWYVARNLGGGSRDLTPAQKIRAWFYQQKRRQEPSKQSAQEALLKRVTDTFQDALREPTLMEPTAWYMSHQWEGRLKSGWPAWSSKQREAGAVIDDARAMPWRHKYAAECWAVEGEDFKTAMNAARVARHELEKTAYTASVGGEVATPGSALTGSERAE